MAYLDSLALPLQIFSCLFLTGLIWTVQLVHYPSFNYIDRNQFLDFHEQHTSKITYVVAPIMGLELLTGIVLFASGEWIWLWNLILILLTWITTGLISVPIHQRLSKIFNEKDIRKLVCTNWIRTALWSIRSLGVLIYLTKYF